MLGISEVIDVRLLCGWMHWAYAEDGDVFQRRYLGFTAAEKNAGE